MKTNLKEDLLYLINPSIKIDSNTIDYLKAQLKHFNEQREMSEKWLSQDLTGQDRMNILYIQRMIEAIQTMLLFDLFLLEKKRKVKYRLLKNIDDDLYSATIKYNKMIHQYGLD